MGRITQRDRVLQYIRDFGSITSYQAFADLGITQLGTRIFELKERGYRFRKKRFSITNGYGDKSHFDEYFLVEE